DFPELPVVAATEPFARALVEGTGVAVSQLELDVFVISFHSSRTDPELLRDPGGPQTGASQGKHMQLAVSQVRRVRMVRMVRMCCRLLDDFMNGAQCNPRTYIKLTCENSINGTDQLVPRAGLHPVA